MRRLFQFNVSERFDKENIQQLNLTSNAATTLTDTLILEDSVDPVHCTTEFINRSIESVQSSVELRHDKMGRPLVFMRCVRPKEGDQVENMFTRVQEISAHSL